MLDTLRTVLWIWRFLVLVERICRFYCQTVLCCLVSHVIGRMCQPLICNFIYVTFACYNYDVTRSIDSVDWALILPWTPHEVDRLDDDKQLKLHSLWKCVKLELYVLNFREQVFKEAQAEFVELYTYTTVTNLNLPEHIRNIHKYISDAISYIYDGNVLKVGHFVCIF